MGIMAWPFDIWSGKLFDDIPYPSNTLDVYRIIHEQIAYDLADKG